MSQINAIHIDYIRLLYKADRTPATGLSISLLPEGTSPPGGLVSLTANGDIGWQYDFPVSITNGKYRVYSSGVVLQNDGVDVEIYVMRGGKVEPEDTTFLGEYTGT